MDLNERMNFISQNQKFFEVEEVDATNACLFNLDLCVFNDDGSTMETRKTRTDS